MAIAFVAVSGSLNTGTGTSGTGSISVGSESNRIALIGINHNGGGDLLTGVVDDLSNTCTFVAKQQISTNDWLYLYQLVAPSTGTRTFTASWSSSVNWSVSAVYYSGAAQTGQPDNSGTSNGSGTSLSNTLTSVADNCWHIMYASNEGSAFSAGSGTTKRSSFSDPAWFDNNAAITPAGSNTINASWSASAPYASVGVTISPLTSTAYTLTAAQGSYTYTGEAITTSWARKITAAFGSFAYTGFAATLSKGKALVAAFGSFSLTGNAATLNSFRHMVASFGSFTLTGIAATFSRALHMVASTGIFAITGISAMLKYYGWAAEGKSSSSWGAQSKSSVSWSAENKSLV